MSFWLKVIFFVALQESLTCSVWMMKAYKLDHNNLRYLALIFLISTLLEIPISFAISYFVKTNVWLNRWANRIFNWVIEISVVKKLIGSKLGISFIAHIRKANSQMSRQVGLTNRKFVLAIFSATLLPVWSSSFLAPWVNLKFKDVFWFLFFASIIWFLLMVIEVLTVSHFIEDLSTAVVVVMILVIAGIYIHNFFSK